MKRYIFQRGERILNSQIEYLKDGGTHGKHRFIIGRCLNCDTIKSFRLDSITSGVTKTCGCHHRKALEDGTLTAYSVRHKNLRGYRIGGKDWNVPIVLLTPKTIERFGSLTLVELYEMVKDFEDA
jgi:hypothetical protein